MDFKIHLLMDLVKGLGKISLILGTGDKDQIVGRWWEIPLQAELETPMYQMSCGSLHKSTSMCLFLSIMASNRLDNKSKSHVSEGLSLQESPAVTRLSY